MRSFIKAAVLGATLLVSTEVFATQISIRIGPPPPPRVVEVVPANPGPSYIWVPGYWYPQGRHYRWHEGYWTLAPYPGAYWVVPRYEGGEYFPGFWEGSRGRFEHNHRWDRDRDRDYNRGERREHERHEHERHERDRG
jgi:WXXGXW repeat (2 copies)